MRAQEVEAKKRLDALADQIEAQEEVLKNRRAEAQIKLDWLMGSLLFELEKQKNEAEVAG